MVTKKHIIFLFILLLLNSCGWGRNMDNEAYQLLRKNVDKFNEYYKGKKIDLAHIDLSNLMIKNANLINADLRGSDLTETNFVKCDFTGANLTGAKLVETIFDTCKLNNVTCIRASFNKVKFYYTIVRESDFHGSLFKECEYHEADFGDSNLNNTIFKKCNFFRSEFQYNEIKNAKMTDVVVNDTRFTGSDFTDTKMQGEFIGNTYFSTTTLLRTNFSGSKFKGSSMASEPNFRAANAIDSNFSKCRIYGLTAMDADFENADFSHAVIELFDAQGSNFKGVNFSHSNLKGVNFGHTDLTNADFTGSSFTNFVILRDAKLDGAKFKNITLFQNPEINLEDTVYKGKKLPFEGRTTKSGPPQQKTKD